MNKIKAIVLKTTEFAPMVVEMENDYRSLQEVVGGCFDVVRPHNYGNKSILADYDIFVNDEGLLMGLEPNIALNMKYLNKRQFDLAGILVGDLIIVGHDGEGNTVGVADEDIDKVIEALKDCMLLNESRDNGMTEIYKQFLD